MRNLPTELTTGERKSEVCRIPGNKEASVQKIGVGKTDGSNDINLFESIFAQRIYLFNCCF